MDRPSADQVDRPSTDPTNRPAEADHRPTDHGPLSVDAAADRLGITPNAVRQRLKRGTLAGHKTPAGWVVVLPTDHSTTPDIGRSPTDRPSAGSRPATDRPRDRLDVAPLADLIADLTRENRRLAETAATLAERNRVLSERLLALEAGPLPSELAAKEPPATAPEAPESPEPAGAALEAHRPWWRRLLGG